MTSNRKIDLEIMFNLLGWGIVNAKPARELALRLGVTPRSLMDMVKNCRDSGLPIIGSKQKMHNGLYLPEFDYEAYDSRDRLIREINSMITTINATSVTVEQWVRRGLTIRTTVPQPFIINPLSFTYFNL